MKPSTPLFVTSLALLAPPAAAEEQHHASLWIEARPWTCSNLVAPLAQEIALACDAAEKACSIAQSAESADRRIVLRCKEGDGRWVLDAETKGGEHLWSLDLTGDEDERLRRAAMWAAHIDSDAPPPATSAPTPHASAPSPSPRPARDAAPAAVPETSATGHGGIALSAHGAYETSTEGVPLAGARGVGAIRVAGRTHVVLALDGVRQVDPGAPPFSLFRAGLGAAWGAPFSDDVLGAGVEVGGPPPNRSGSAVCLVDPTARST